MNWIFRNLSFEIPEGTTYALTGKNGSGKSTLLQILSGFLTPSEGEVLYHNEVIDIEKTNFALIGPYTEIIEEFSLKEFLVFHSHFKKALIPIEEMAMRASLPLDKPILEFSTGMKQRSKLITAFFFENDMLFLDEPTSNLDEEGFEWWKKELLGLKGKTILIASNQNDEIVLCDEKLNL